MVVSQDRASETALLEHFASFCLSPPWPPVQECLLGVTKVSRSVKGRAVPRHATRKRRVAERSQVVAMDRAVRLEECEERLNPWVRSIVRAVAA